MSQTIISSTSTSSTSQFTDASVSKYSHTSSSSLDTEISIKIDDADLKVPTVHSPINRIRPRINYFTASVKVVVSVSILATLILGYIFGIRVVGLGFTSIGLYGTLLICDFLIQFTCAIINRISVNKIVRKKIEGLQQSKQSEKTDLGTHPGIPILNENANIAIACVGYREDEMAWRQCLRSLQVQTIKPRVIIAVVDGNEGPDMDMARAFEQEFKSKKARVLHLPSLLSSQHRSRYLSSMNSTGLPPTKWNHFANWCTGRRSHESKAALSQADQCVADQVERWIEDFKLEVEDLEAFCIVQPHGHKRTAMFTSFAFALHAFKTEDAIFTTDSDTLVQPNALDEMFTLLNSDPAIGGVTADVRIWNRADSILARMCSVRYWMAFNIERACQSWWRCVGCLSGPMGMYRAYDMATILGPWNLQTFGGKETTFGDDRHLTNQLLAHGLQTRYTHRTYCESESPTKFVRWVKQQTRWSKSFFREAFWFPKAFAYHSWWLLVETTKQALYPFILVATICHFLFSPADPLRPLIWLATMFIVAFVKSLVAVFISRDLWMLAFSGYGFIYFFGLLPSKFFALLTVNITSWGTSARSQGEIRKGDSFTERSFHVGYLVCWYFILSVGIAFFVSRIFSNWYFMFVTLAFLPPSALLYHDLLWVSFKDALAHFAQHETAKKTVFTANQTNIYGKEEEEIGSDKISDTLITSNSNLPSRVPSETSNFYNLQPISRYSQIVRQVHGYRGMRDKRQRTISQDIKTIKVPMPCYCPELPKHRE